MSPSASEFISCGVQYERCGGSLKGGGGMGGVPLGRPRPRQPGQILNSKSSLQAEGGLTWQCMQHACVQLCWHEPCSAGRRTDKAPVWWLDRLQVKPQEASQDCRVASSGYVPSLLNWVPCLGQHVGACQMLHCCLYIGKKTQKTELVIASGCASISWSCHLVVTYIWLWWLRQHISALIMPFD